MHDVVIVGGSYAGLAAALQLGRARRSVLIVDAGQRRNRFATSSHGFLGQDGAAAADIAAKGRAEVLAYPTVAWLDGEATEVARDGDGFVVRTGSEAHAARRVILATGVTDVLPPIEGLWERWGKSVFHCPYCHGYELDRGTLGVLATAVHSPHQALLVREWGRATTLYLNEAAEPDAETQAKLAARGIDVRRERVVRVGGDAPAVELVLDGGEVVRLDGLFVAPHTELPRVVAGVGCELDDGPMGRFLRTDTMMKETSVPGLFACGDVALPAPSVALAVADGTRAGIATHQSLVFR